MLADVLIEEGVSGSVPVEERPIGGALFAKLERGDIVKGALSRRGRALWFRGGL
jgi:hypothetical protein